MERLTSSNVAALQRRYFNFNDGVVRRVELSFAHGVLERRLTVELLVQDDESQDGWGSLRLEFRRVASCSLVEERSTNAVLSQGVVLVVEAQGVEVDFSPVHDEGVKSSFSVTAAELWFGAGQANP